MTGAAAMAEPPWQPPLPLGAGPRATDAAAPSYIGAPISRPISQMSFSASSAIISTTT